MKTGNQIKKELSKLGIRVKSVRIIKSGSMAGCFVASLYESSSSIMENVSSILNNNDFINFDGCKYSSISFNGGFGFYGKI